MLLLVVLFVALPLAEIAVIIQVGDWLGVLDTIALLLVLSVGGAWVVKHQGMGLLARVRRELAAGEVPKDSLVDGVLLLTAGVLLLTPGFITDAFGILLLLPPVRAVIRAGLRRRFARRATGGGAGRRYPEIDL